MSSALPVAPSADPGTSSRQVSTVEAGQWGGEMWGSAWGVVAASNDTCSSDVGCQWVMVAASPC